MARKRHLPEMCWERYVSPPLRMFFEKERRAVCHSPAVSGTAAGRKPTKFGTNLPGESGGDEAHHHRPAPSPIDQQGFESPRVVVPGPPSTPRETRLAQALFYEDEVRKLWAEGLKEVSKGGAQLDVWRNNVRRHKKQEKRARKKHAQNVRALKYLVKRQARRLGAEKEVPWLDEVEHFPFLD